MHPFISQFPENYIYDNRLEDGCSTDSRRDSRLNDYWNPSEKPILFIRNMTGEKWNNQMRSWSNPGEVLSF